MSLLRHLAFTCILLAASVAGAAQKGPAKLSDGQVKKQVIQESIDSYPGNCPCPYNAARNGSRCGGRSAWSRGGGYSPICYENEVTKEMIQSWREQHASPN